MERTYTKAEVEELLEKQRSLCYRNAEIDEFEYDNPYSDSDGSVEYRVSKDSIMDAVLELKR